MNAEKVFQDVVSTPAERVSLLPNEAILVAAAYAAEMGFALEALMCGVEIGQRVERDSDPALLAELTRRVDW